MKQLTAIHIPSPDTAELNPVDLTDLTQRPTTAPAMELAALAMLATTTLAAMEEDMVAIAAKTIPTTMMAKMSPYI